MTLLGIANEIVSLMKAGCTLKAAIARVMPQASVLFSRGKTDDPEKGYIGRFQTLQGLIVPEVLDALKRGDDVSVAAIRKVGSLNNARNAIIAGAAGKGEKRSEEDVTGEIEKALTKKEKAPSKAPSRSEIVARIAEEMKKGDLVVANALKWSIGALEA